MTKTSAACSARCLSSSWVRPADPTSSSPSTNTVTPMGGLPEGPQCRQVNRKAALVIARASAVQPIPDLGRHKGGVRQLAGSPSGWTSWWA